ncbi:GTPase IMAP family member 9-like [Neolamprologus brichardi]|uniref:GTPase IMAP family member 9-like n=1 Tax=Neolamprologus brichardi TaxID=32507 RepID=UPI0003EC529D|nr:GTPase IMAP family member 9-like [Neolamprologus brichardi]
MAGKHANDGPTKLRIILVGKTGAGKTSTINTFLGKPAVKKNRLLSGTTPCKTETAQFGDQELVLVDTPGLCHTKFTKEEVLSEITASVFEADQGPHVFLYVQKWEGDNTEDEKRVEALKKMFGDASGPYFFLLMTHVDGAEDEITKFTQRVGFKTENYCVLNNKGEKEQKAEKVKELVDKINQVVQTNKAEGKDYYTKEMLEEHKNRLKPTYQVSAANRELSSVVEGLLAPVLGEELTLSVLEYNSSLSKEFDERL